MVGAKLAQNLEMVGGEFVQGINFPPHVPCRNWVTVGYRFPPGPFFGGWFFLGCCGIGRVLAVWGTVGQVLVARQQDKNRKGVCLLGVMGKQERE